MSRSEAIGTSGGIPLFSLYGEPVKEVEERYLHIEDIGSRSRLHDWKIRPHAHHNLHHLLWIEAGGGKLVTEEGSRRFEGPAVIRVPKSFVHGFEFCPTTDGWVLTVSDSLLQRIADQHPSLRPVPDGAMVLALPQRDIGSRRLAEAFWEVAQEFRGSAPGRRAAIESALVLLLVTVLRMSPRQPVSEVIISRGDALLVARFQQLLESEFKGQLRIEDYARCLATSRERLRSACKRITGHSPVQLLLQRRLLEAKRGLLYTNMTVAQVAASCGFGDPAYMSRQFSRHTGETPSEFRSRREQEEVGRA